MDLGETRRVIEIPIEEPEQTPRELPEEPAVPDREKKEPAGV